MTMPSHPAQGVRRDYARSPLLVYWELTRACSLACRHCRAEAQAHRHPLELSTEEGYQLLRQIADFGPPLPHLVLTGGDPLSRLDLFALIDEARRLGLPVSITPSVTELLTYDALVALRRHGIQSLGLSLDGSCAARHDAIRGIPGCFERSLSVLQWAEEIGLAVQVNTLVAAETVDDLPAIYQLLTTQSIMRWGLFFLIGVGRGALLHELSPERAEELMHWIYELSSVAPFALKTTEAPSYRRVALAHLRQEGVVGAAVRGRPVSYSFGIRDGHGIVFVSHTGEVSPSGFLPIAVGNVRQHALAELYRSASVFASLHDVGQLRGKCGYCEYRAICGGSRARAFAAAGHFLESDPLCPYQPVRGAPTLEG